MVTRSDGSCIVHKREIFNSQSKVWRINVKLIPGPLHEFWSCSRETLFKTLVLELWVDGISPTQ